MIFHDHSDAGATLVEDVAEVKHGRREGHSIHREDSEHGELDGEYLICPHYLNGYPHSEFLILILGGDVFILLHQILLAICQNSAVWPELKPDFKCTVALDVPERRVEFKIGLETLREEKLELHWLGATIVKNNLLSVELLINQNIEVIFWLSNKYRDINAVTEYFDGDRLAIVLIIQEKSECLPHRAQFVGNESESNSSRVIAFNII
jgi:hypothetical protein